MNSNISTRNNQYNNIMNHINQHDSNVINCINQHDSNMINNDWLSGKINAARKHTSPKSMHDCKNLTNKFSIVKREIKFEILCNFF